MAPLVNVLNCETWIPNKQLKHSIPLSSVATIGHRLTPKLTPTGIPASEIETG